MATDHLGFEKSNTDWNLISLIVMVSLMVGLYLWNRFGNSKQRKYAFAVFLVLSISFSIFMNTGSRPGGLFIVA